MIPVPEDTLFDRIFRFIEAGREDAPALAELATSLACLHHERMPLYRTLCEMRGVRPDAVQSIEDLPGIPTEAFKRLELHISPESVCRRFTTSGTSGGEDRKGVACFSEQDLLLMDAAVDTCARKYLFPDCQDRRTFVLAIAPTPQMAPAMIMVYGMERLMREFGHERSAFLIGPDGLDFPRLLDLLGWACSEGIPVTLIGASFGFAHLFDAFDREHLQFSLPCFSRVMDAGGFKGKSREIDRADMVAALEKHLCVRREYCVNVLGLTEHASQFYDDAVSAAFENRPCRTGKQNAPWTRTWAVDPETLSVLPHGERGILRHLDLSNGGHPFLIQTDDVGTTREDGFEVIGRPGVAEARGCSITVDELLNPRDKA